MIGVTGSGIAYLQMVRDGYVWCDHFENLSLTRKPKTKKSPDFVFSKPGERDVAIAESKATQGSSRTQFLRTVETGYVEQIHPYLGFEVGGAVASHGYSIGSWMTSPSKAELLIDHTAVAEPANVNSSGAPSDPSSVKRGNYLTVLSLLFGPDLPAALRARRPISLEASFPIVRWIGREWLAGYTTVPGTAGYDKATQAIAHSPSVYLLNRFALELDVARAFFTSIFRPADAADPLETVGRMDDELIAQARAAGGAVYPDGFSILGSEGEVIDTLNWDRLRGGLADRTGINALDQAAGPALADLTTLALSTNLDSLMKGRQPLSTFVPRPNLLTYRGPK
ncbi:hypothetical protein MesoLj113a_09940 [Mesorhizobium sp. 113-1-2]|nr:hypothetical protein MesoLj113a_09940 [Mesorhizobium sp. 113-1-2]